MTVDWHVSNVPPSTYREGTNSIDSTNSTDSIDSANSLTDSAGISLSEKDKGYSSYVLKWSAKYLKYGKQRQGGSIGVRG